MTSSSSSACGASSSPMRLRDHAGQVESCPRAPIARAAESPPAADDRRRATSARARASRTGAAGRPPPSRPAETARSARPSRRRAAARAPARTSPAARRRRRRSRRRPAPVSVAPNRSACSCLRSSTSIARISDAPASRAPWTTERPTAPQPMTATLAPSGTRAVSSTDITPVATAQPSRQACSDGSSAGIFTAAAAGTTVRVANVPVRKHRRKRRRRRFDAGDPAAAGGRLHCRGSPRTQNAHAPHGGVPAEHDAVAGRDVLDAGADRLDRSRALVPEQDRQRMPPAVLLDDVEVRVADAARLDPDGDFARLRLVDDDLLERDRARRAQDDAAIHDASRSRDRARPISASVRSVSAASCSISAADARLAADRERVRRTAARRARRSRRAPSP